MPRFRIWAARTALVYMSCAPIQHPPPTFNWLEHTPTQGPAFTPTYPPSTPPRNTMHAPVLAAHLLHGEPRLARGLAGHVGLHLTGPGG